MPRRSRAATKRKGALPPTRAHLEHLVEEALVDAHGESEERTGIYTMLEEHLELPFEARVLGVPATVVRLDIDEGDEIVAVCRRGTKREAVPILELRIVEPRPRGSEWIEAHRLWARRL